MNLQSSVENKLLNILAKGVLLIFLWVTAIFCLITRFSFSLYFATALGGLSLFFGASLVLDFYKLKQVNDDAEEVLEVTPAEEVLKICKDYCNGSTYQELRKTYNLKYDMQVQRCIKQGLKLLLLEHTNKTNNL